MQHSTQPFPKGFLWGGATADFQYEGGFNEGGRGINAQDFVTDGSVGRKRQITLKMADGSRGSVNSLESLPEGAEPCMYDDQYYPSHKAVDFYHHWKEDIHLMAEMGFSVFRFSICWSRIFPTGDELTPNEEGLDFYEKVIDECLACGIEPLITICHDEMPDHLARHYNGWHSRHLIDCYVRYATALFDRYKGKVKYWLTFNELNLIHGYSKIGVHRMDPQTYYQAEHHMFVASAITIREGHKRMPDAIFGSMFAMSAMYPATCKPEDVFAWYKQRRENYFFIDTMARGEYPNYAAEIFARKNVKLDIREGDLELIKAYPLDFVSFSYYRSTTICADHFTSIDPIGIMGGDTNPYLPKTPWNWSLDPLGLRFVLNELYDRYQKPVFVIENGLGEIDKLEEDGTVHDLYRMKFLSEHFQQMKDAINIDKVPCFGYTMWAPIDLVSLGTGEMKKRYGFVYVDMDDKGNGSLKRYKKDSFDWMKKVIASNGEDLNY